MFVAKYSTRVFEIGEIDRGMEAIQKKLDWIRDQAKKGANEFTASLLCQRAPRPRSAKDVRNSMKILEDHGYVRVVRKDVWALKG